MRLQLDARARRWVGRLPVANIYSAAELALLAVLAVEVARLAWAVATPVGPLGDWRPAGVSTPASPADALAGFDPFFRLDAPAAAAPTTVTSLRLTLFGTRLDDATGRGAAILAGPDGVQRPVSVGEEVAPGVTLKAVAFDHVTLRRGGADEDLFLDQSGAAPPVGPVMSDGAPPAGPGPMGPGPGVQAAQLRTDVGFIPRIDGGRLNGLTVRSQGSGVAFRAAGLRDGDVVTQVAGRPVTGADALDRIARDYPRGGNVALTVERGGQPVPLTLLIAPPQ